MLDSPHYQMFHSLVLKSTPILLYLDEKQRNHPRLSIPNVKDIRIEDLLEIHPLDLESLVKGPEIMEELERELMIEKILTQIVTQFLLGFNLQKIKNEEHNIEAKLLLKRAYKISASFLPDESFIFQTVSAT